MSVETALGSNEYAQKRLMELPSKERTWVERGLRWGHFKQRDLLEHYPWVRRVLSVIDTAVHEMGHVHMIKKGGTLYSATVVPSGNYLGLTKGIPNSLEDGMRAHAGGLVAEEGDGQQDHRGAGSDMWQLEMAAQSSGALSISAAISQARSEIYPIIDSLRHDALGLAIKQTITA